MKYISILGDSISTFEGYNPEGYLVYYDRVTQLNNAISDVEDSWWMKVIRYLDGTLLVNDSYSGSRVSGKDFPSASCFQRLQNLAVQDKIPDIILVYMGYNDFGYEVRIPKIPMKDEDYGSFAFSYDLMLKRLSELYPSTTIICGTLMKTVWKEHDYWTYPSFCEGKDMADYNNIIRKACQKHSVLLADLEKTGLRYETLDTSHGTVLGQATIAEAWIRCLNDIIL